MYMDPWLQILMGLIRKALFVYGYENIYSQSHDSSIENKSEVRK